MELAWIEDFLALAESGNFTRAAEIRHTTQPAYSRRIKQLEDWLGAALFDRGMRPIVLTDAGRDFLPRARNLRGEMMEARRSIRSSLTRLERPQRIYTTNTLAIGFYPGWAAVQEDRPRALFVASGTGCRAAVQAGRADYALLPRFADDAETDDAEIIGQDRLILVQRKDAAPRLGLNGGTLSGPLLTYAPGTVFAAQVERRLAAENIALAAPPLGESASAEALLALVRAGHGGAWVPEMLTGDGDNLRRIAAPRLSVSYDIVLLRKS